jgi:dihydrofolate synthase/folylpolyglutamate synthase
METAAAFHLFAKQPADVVLLEVGLGGRGDSTNVVDKPLATVITPVAMDHMDMLGDTLARAPSAAAHRRPALAGQRGAWTAGVPGRAGPA